ncbi:MAG TPA: CHAD domain-containing protein [Ktedonobacteraceae bacterium]|nr:CHAD domain-containing protein [Ktedonobacteraceae bacterium]
MENQSALMSAAIDVGSNTIHIVVARCFPTTLEIVADEVEMVRIGESVTATGAISSEKSLLAIRVLKEYRELAEKHGAQSIFVAATEAIRQASNSTEFIDQVREETGLEIRLISGVIEAELTFFGATYEAGNPEQVEVMDLGGGSMELVLARNMQIVWRTSLPVGSGWLHDSYLSSDPPSTDEIETAETFLHTYFRTLPAKRSAPLLIVTGGSANSLFFLAQKALHYESEERRLDQKTLQRCRALLSALEAKDIATLYQQPLARAKILLAGILIIQHVMQRLQVEEIRVTEHGIREGVLLAYARYGEKWQEILAQGEITATESFVESARRLLVERLHTMLGWQEEVLKHEDIEAVHKMRVASRRLRATLDAYQSCCDPALFAKVYRKIKKTANILGEARDADVQILSLSAQLADLGEEEKAGVRWLIERLQTYRKQKQHELDAFLHKLDGEKLEHLLKRCVQEGMGK